MKTMTDIEVIINNKRYTLCGYESSEYLQKVASYINNKYMEFKLKDNYKRLEPDLKNILLQINIADDYFKAQRRANELEEDGITKSNEIFEMKHELIVTQTKLEQLQRELDSLKKENQEAGKKIIRLETELEDKR